MTGAAPTVADAAAAEFRRDVLQGLAASQKTLPGKYLWDERGSQLFEDITRSPLYYPTSLETALLAGAVGDISQLAGPDASLVEFGSGATHKVALLLDALETPRRYIGIDISSAFTAAAAARLRSAYPQVRVEFVEADFSGELPPLPLDREHPVVGFLLGCAICNMQPSEAESLLARVRRAMDGGLLLVGQDTNQDAPRLLAAYGNPAMQAFHCNILARLRSELGASLAPEHFRHEARVLDSPRRVEAHVVATTPTEIVIDDRVHAIEAGGSIRTDVSVKYTADVFEDLARSAGWTAVRRWSDAEELYCLHLLRSP